jgi:hypothetical protein
VASDNGWAEVEGLHEGGHVGCEILRTIARRRTICVAVASLGEGESANGIGKVRQHALEGVPRVGDAVQQQNRNAKGVPLFNVRDPDPIGKRNRIDSESHYGWATTGYSIRHIFISGCTTTLACGVIE